MHLNLYPALLTPLTPNISLYRSTFLLHFVSYAQHHQWLPRRQSRSRHVVAGLSSGQVWVGQCCQRDWGEGWRTKGWSEKKGVKGKVCEIGEERCEMLWIFCFKFFHVKDLCTMISRWVECWSSKALKWIWRVSTVGPCVLMKISKMPPLLNFHNSKIPITCFQFP